MKLAYSILAEREETDLLFADLAAGLGAEGWRCCGVVQVNTRAWDDHRCDMDVQILPDGEVLRISQNLGTLSKGCRVDPSALERSAGAAMAQLTEGADVLILNKFGKLEVEGRGFRELIGAALDAGVPVIIGLSEKNLAPFLEFSDNMATRVEPDMWALRRWLGVPEATDAA